MLTLALTSLTTTILAQNPPNTPPAESPMPMKPEMTEIWEPQVKVIMPGKMQVTLLPMLLSFLMEKI